MSREQLRARQSFLGTRLQEIVEAFILSEEFAQREHATEVGIGFVTVVNLVRLSHSLRCVTGFCR
jgi:hypothetical protein